MQPREASPWHIVRALRYCRGAAWVVVVQMVAGNHRALHYIQYVSGVPCQVYGCGVVGAKLFGNYFLLQDCQHQYCI
jgi:hypothetical protein